MSSSHQTKLIPVYVRTRVAFKVQPNRVLISVLKFLSARTREQPSVITSIENEVTLWRCIFYVCRTVCSWLLPLERCICPWSNRTCPCVLWFRWRTFWAFFFV